jgi:hypothetical protein
VTGLHSAFSRSKGQEGNAEEGCEEIGEEIKNHQHDEEASGERRLPRREAKAAGST